MGRATSYLYITCVCVFKYTSAFTKLFQSKILNSCEKMGKPDKNSLRIESFSRFICYICIYMYMVIEN